MGVIRRSKNKTMGEETINQINKKKLKSFSNSKQKI